MPCYAVKGPHFWSVVEVALGKRTASVMKCSGNSDGQGPDLIWASGRTFLRK